MVCSAMGGAVRRTLTLAISVAACGGAAAKDAAARPKEFQGPKGPEPTRYGDWETKGIASDF